MDPSPTARIFSRNAHPTESPITATNNTALRYLGGAWVPGAASASARPPPSRANVVVPRNLHIPPPDPHAGHFHIGSAPPTNIVPLPQGSPNPPKGFNHPQQPPVSILPSSNSSNAYPCPTSDNSARINANGASGTSRAPVSMSLPSPKHPAPPRPESQNKRLRSDIPAQKPGVGSPDQFPTNAVAEPAYCASLVEYFVQSSGGYDKLHPYVTARIQLLRTAWDCPRGRRMDCFCLVLHQIACATEYDVSKLPAAISVLPRRNEAMTILNQLWFPTYELGPRFIEYFSAFPRLLEALQDTSGYYSNVIDQVARFLSLLACSWDSICLTSRSRGYPPVATELVQKLGLFSPTLQQVAFRAVARQIWNKPPDPVIERAEIIFNDSQDEGARTNFADPHLQWYARRFGDITSSPSFNTPNWIQPGSPNYPQIPVQTPQPLQQPLLHIGSNVATSMQAPLRPFNQQPLPTRACPTQSALSQAPINSNIPSPRLVSSVSQIRGSERLLTTRHQQQTPLFIAPSQSAQITTQRRASDNSLPLQSQSLASPATSALSNFTMSSPMVFSPVLFFPKHGFAPRQLAIPDPSRTALHLADLQSPLLEAEKKHPATGSTSRLYQYVAGFALRPTPILMGKKIQDWSFELSDAEFKAIPFLKPKGSGTITRMLNSQSITYRFRCVLGSPSIDEHQWIAADTSWPAYCYFNLNGKSLQHRRKLHHGKDLHADITPHVSKGKNVIRMFSNMSASGKTTSYIIAIETVRVKSHEDILKECQLFGTRSKEEIKSSIVSSLRPGAKRLAPGAEFSSAGCTTSEARYTNRGDDSDDELVILSNNLTIGLFDPILGVRIWDLPVRGKACRHREAFDLHTFLETRRYKESKTLTLRARPQGSENDVVADADEWRCPICSADARPQVLIIDGWLQEVRKELAEAGLLDTRSIIVEADGTWKPKPATNSAASGINILKNQTMSISGVAPPSAQRVSEVVELDD